MSKHLLLPGLVFFFLFSNHLFGQYKPVSFDYELSTFNDNNPLPAETSMIISGSIPDEVQMVEVNIYTFKGKDDRQPIYSGNWKRPYNKPKGDFRVPINYQLQASKKYDFRINYFKKIDTQQRSELYDQLTTALDAYIHEVFEIKKSRLELDKKTGQCIRDMNELVRSSLKYFRSFTSTSFQGFSDIIKEQLDNLDGKDLPQVKEDSSRILTSNTYLEELTELIHNEVRYIINDDLGKLTDSRYVDDYVTEDKPGYFSLNVGYGATYLGGNIDNLEYGTSPYVSIGFPLSTSRIAPDFLRNASFTFGIFTSNFENNDGDQITGPIIGRPIQFGLDYKLFQFIRFNLGASLLEEQKGSNNGQNGDQSIIIQPFVGFSAKINLQLSLDK